MCVCLHEAKVCVCERCVSCVCVCVSVMCVCVYMFSFFFSYRKSVLIQSSMPEYSDLMSSCWTSME